jgi:hypothetical protein
VGNRGLLQLENVRNRPEDSLIGALHDAAEKFRPLQDAIHRKAMRLFREYMLVGGYSLSVS